MSVSFFRFEKFKEIYGNLAFIKKKPSVLVKLYKILKAKVKEDCMLTLADMMTEADTSAKFKELSKILEQNAPFVGEAAWYVLFFLFTFSFYLSFRKCNILYEKLIIQGVRVVLSVILIASSEKMKHHYPYVLLVIGSGANCGYKSQLVIKFNPKILVHQKTGGWFAAYLSLTQARFFLYYSFQCQD